MADKGGITACALLKEGETADSALGGAVGVIQPASGFRFSIDAVLLARFAAECGEVERAADLCSGSGVVSLCLLALGAAKEVVGVDIQPAFVERAARSAEWNGLASRARFLCSDAKEIPGAMKGGAFDLVTCNPPYRSLQGGKVSQDPSLAIARYEVSMTLEDAVMAAAHLLKKGGRFSLVYPATGVARVLQAIKESGLSAERLRFLHPNHESPASLFLMGAVKSSKGKALVQPPLILHGPHGCGRKYSEEAERLLGRP